MKSDRIKALNAQFEINYNSWTQEQTDKHCRIKQWNFPIIISAPHAVNHIRNWELLKADLQTWWIALYLSEKFNLSCIYSTSSLVWDPNFDSYENSEYKKLLKEYISNNNIKLLVDLHWCWSERDFAIELWTWWDTHKNLLWNQKLLSIIQDNLSSSLNSYLKHNQQSITLNSIFPASNPNTVSSFTSSQLKIPSIQIEINKSLREEKNLDLLIQALENTIEQLLEYFSTN